MKTPCKAPSFKLKDKNGKTHDLKSIKADNIVLYFYPKDDTAGCTIEAKRFNTELARFKALKTAVVGISGGDSTSKANFCKKYKLNLTLLSDPQFKVCKAYKAWGTKTFMGRKFKGILRNTYLINKKREIVKVFEKVSPGTHAKEVLRFIKGAKTATWQKAASPARKILVKKQATPKRSTKSRMSRPTTARTTTRSRSRTVSGRR